MINIFNCQSDVRLNKKFIKFFAERVLILLNKKGYNVNFIFVDKPKITNLNKKYLSKNRVTDVISFGFCDDKQCKRIKLLGDIFICPQVAKENSKIFKNSLKHEVALYITHGILHLLGYKDYTKKEYRHMEARQMNLLTQILPARKKELA